MITIKAFAKINLTLDVLGKRPDGYHELSTIMQSVNLYDIITFKKTPFPGISLKTNNPALSVDESNLVFSVAKFLLLEYNIRHGVSIELIKHIPIAAGLAGGSTDCAATLLVLNDLLEINLSKKRLYEIGKNFGADVPFCIMGGTALAQGIGEKLQPIANHPQTWIVLARLPILVSTKEIFSRWSPRNAKPKSQAMIEALASGDIFNVANNLANDLAPIAMDMHPEIYNLLTAFKEQNALGVNMSGSGPSVFAYFPTEHAALSAIDCMKQRFSGCQFFCVQPKTREMD